VITPSDFVLRSAAAAPCDVTFCFEREGDLGGREAYAAQGRCDEKRWVRLLGRAREERALLWSAPEENAIYLLRSEGPAGSVLDPLEFLPGRGGTGEAPE
jgi:hypothetical protein